MGKTDFKYRTPKCLAKIDQGNFTCSLQEVYKVSFILSKASLVMIDLVKIYHEYVIYNNERDHFKGHLTTSSSFPHFFNKKRYRCYTLEVIAFVVTVSLILHLIYKEICKMAAIVRTVEFIILYSLVKNLKISILQFF